MALVEIPQSEVEATDLYSDAEFGAMLRAVLNLFEKWKLSDAEIGTLLGGMSRSSVQRLKAGRGLSNRPDMADRLSNFLGIHKALRLLFVDNDRAYEWVKKPNRGFDGETALQIMLRGHLTDIMRVRRLLDSARGAW